MFRIVIDTTDLTQKLKSIDPATMVRTVAEAVADEAVVPEMAKYPTASGKKQPFRSNKSQRFFFAALRRGQINVPYRRTGKVGETEKQPTAQGMDVVSKAAHSDKVRTKGKQWKYHEGTWEDTESMARRLEGDSAELIATAVVIDQLQKAGLT